MYISFLNYLIFLEFFSLSKRDIVLTGLTLERKNNFYNIVGFYICRLFSTLLIGYSRMQRYFEQHLGMDVDKFSIMICQFCHRKFMIHILQSVDVLYRTKNPPYFQCAKSGEKKYKLLMKIQLLRSVLTYAAMATSFCVSLLAASQPTCL